MVRVLSRGRLENEGSKRTFNTTQVLEHNQEITNYSVVVFFTLTDRASTIYPVIYVVANLVRGHKEVPRSTGHIMMTTRYSDQQGSKSRQKVMRLYSQWHRPISKRFIKPPYSISRTTSIDSDRCRLPTTNVLSNKADKLRSNQF